MTKQWTLWLALMLSVGINVGLLAGRAVHRVADDRPADLVAESRSGDQAKERKIPRRLHRIIRRMANELQLEGEKRRRFLANQERFFLESAAGRDRLRGARMELRRELTAEDPDPGRAEHWVAELGTAQADLERAFITNYFDTRALLEPRQEERFRRFMTRIYRVRRELMERRDPRRREPLRRQRPGDG